MLDSGRSTDDHCQSTGASLQILINERSDRSTDGLDQVLDKCILGLRGQRQVVVGHVATDKHLMHLLEQLQGFALPRGASSGLRRLVDLVNEAVNCKAQRAEHAAIEQAKIAEHQPANVADVRGVGPATHFLLAAEVVDRQLQRRQLGIEELRQILQFTPLQHGLLEQLASEVPQLRLGSSRTQPRQSRGKPNSALKNWETHALLRDGHAIGIQVGDRFGVL